MRMYKKHKLYDFSRDKVNVDPEASPILSEGTELSATNELTELDITRMELADW